MRKKPLLIAGIALVVLIAGSVWWTVAKAKRIDRLAANLTSNDPVVKADAMERLSSLTSASDIGGLAQHLDTEDNTAQQAIAAAIAANGERAIEPLETAMRAEATSYGSTSAIRMLFGSREDSQESQKESERHGRAMFGFSETLNLMGRTGADLVLALTKDQDRQVRWFAASTFYNASSPEMLDASVTSFASRDSTVAMQAIMSTARTRYEKAVEPLLGLLDDRDPQIREQAARALAFYPYDPRVTDKLIPFMLNPRTNSFFKASVAGALAHSTDPRALQALIAALPNGIKDTRDTVVHALVALPDDRKWAAMAAALSDKDGGTRLGAAEFFAGTIDAREAPALLEAYPSASAEGKRGIVVALKFLSELDLPGHNVINEKARLIDPDVPKTAKEALATIESSDKAARDAGGR